MPIDFRCPQCGKLLRTPDDSAGKQARCPQCSAILKVPVLGAANSAPLASPTDPSAESGWDESDLAERAPPPHASADPNRDFPSYAPATLHRASHAPTELTPTRLDPGDILKRTWTILKSQLGNVILALLVAWFAQFGIIRGIDFSIEVVAAATNSVTITTLFYICGSIVGWAASVWIQAGMIHFTLKIARGQETAIGDLFVGQRWIIPLFIAGLLLSIAITVGLFLLVIPGLIVALMFWPCQFLIVDRDLQPLESFSAAKTLTDGNKVSLFVLGVISFLIMLVAAIPLLLGWIVAVPYLTLMMAVTYLTMSGQRTAEQM